MRVAVNVEQLLSRSPGGIGRYCGQVVTLLASSPPPDDMVPFVARHSAGAVGRALSSAGIDARAVTLPWPRAALYEGWVRWGVPPLPLHAALAGVDVVHATSAAVPPRQAVPLVATVHDAAAELFPEAFTRQGRRFHSLGARAAASRADLVIAPTGAAADEIVAHTPIPARKVRVVHHAVSPPVLDAGRRAAILRGRRLEGGYVLWVGSLEPRKGVATLVVAMAGLRRAGAARVPLVLAGFTGWLSDGSVPVAERRELDDDLVVLGPVGEEELWALYGGATVFALPSRHEGFGLPVLEAMSQGAPVVCSDLPALREVAGTAASFVPAGDPAAWSDAIGSLLSDEAARSELGAAGRQRAAAFGAERFVAGTRAVYREAAGQR